VAATDDSKRQDEESASRRRRRRHVLFIEKPGKIITAPGKDDLDERSLMQFKYDPVDGHLFSLGAFNILKIAG